LAHRERIQQIEGFPAHRNPLRQARAKLPGLSLPRRSAGMVDLMSRDPSITVVIFCWRDCLIAESMGHHDLGLKAIGRVAVPVRLDFWFVMTCH
jgi:hypothetical protein